MYWAAAEDLSVIRCDYFKALLYIIFRLLINLTVPTVPSIPVLDISKIKEDEEPIQLQEPKTKSKRK